MAGTLPRRHCGSCAQIELRNVQISDEKRSGGKSADGASPDCLEDGVSCPNRIRQISFVSVLLILAPVLFGRLAGGAQNGLPATDAPPIISVPGSQSWTRTGLRVAEGQHLTIVEEKDTQGRLSSVSVRKQGWVIARQRAKVTARGSYQVFTSDRQFPMPSFLDDGRWPAYCLIGRIGESGQPFYIGPRYEGKANASGNLWLGINDPDPKRNTGLFLCSARVGETPANSSNSQPPASANPGAAKPVSDATVVIFFFDGVRPDVLQEMVRMGHMPTFEKMFCSGGTWVKNAIGILPTLTESSFASMMTGTFSDRHNLKMQYCYDRSKGYFVDNMNKWAYPRIAREIRQTGVKALYDYFPDAFGGGALPIQPRAPKVLHASLAEWYHRTINVVNIWANMLNAMDEAQTRYALDLIANPQVKVMVIWYPATDIQSECWPHGQFGRSRTNVANMDHLLAQVVRRLDQRGRLDKTYFVAFSDHGTVGGNGFMNHMFDVPKEIIVPHFRIGTRSLFGPWPCPGTPRSRFAVLGDAEGLVEISLPYKKADSGDLSRPNFLDDLQNYQLADGRRLNAMDILTEWTAKGHIPASDMVGKPVDFAVARCDRQTVFLQRTTQSEAFITRRQRPDGDMEFKYEPVRGYLPGGSRQPIESGDPLGYLDSRSFVEAVSQNGASVKSWLNGYHTGREWLKATAGTDYPGCIDAISLFFACRDEKKEQNLPDVMLFAAKGWVFIPDHPLADRYDYIPATRHGMAFREATNISLFFSGPGVARGKVLEESQRITDILPTVLTMMSKEWKHSDLDGVPIEGIWEGK